MARIVYLSFPTGAVSGGQKMSLRHVETLCDLGFEAVFWHNADNVLPTWLDHRAPVEVSTHFRPDDILVVPCDAANAMRVVASRPNPAVVLCQAQVSLMMVGLAPLNDWPRERFPPLITVGPSSTETIRRFYPDAQLEMIRCFADERLFKPAAKRPSIALTPVKRPQEAEIIEKAFRHLHPRHAHLPWLSYTNAREADLARAFGEASLFLNLGRFESVGLAPIEAMAAGALCAGFTGGPCGRDVARPDNGFWVDEDDVLAAVDALARAADVAAAGGPELERYLAAGRATADWWSYQAFRDELEAVWMRLAPQARTRAKAGEARI